MTNPDEAPARTIPRVNAITLAAGFEEESPIEPSDEVLMLAVARRDDAAFAAIYNRYADLVYATCLRVLADPGLAQDAAQDVFVRLWRRPEAFVSSRGRFISWLMSVARNRAVDELRARGRRQRREGGDSEELLASVADKDAPDPQHAAELQEQRQRVRTALDQIPAEQRAALELAYFGGLTHQEIAITLHEPLGTIKTRIRLAMQKLRPLLAESRTDGPG